MGTRSGSLAHDSSSPLQVLSRAPGHAHGLRGLASVVLLAFLPTVVHAAAAVDSLTIAECVSRARAQAPELLASRLEQSAAVFDSLAVARNGRPAWAIDAGATVAPRGFYDPTVTDLGGYQAKLGVAWTSHDGGRRARERERGRLALWPRAPARRPPPATPGSRPPSSPPSCCGSSR
jgi:hypothetical protein